MVYTIFLHIMDSLLIKYDLMIFFCGFFQIFIKCSDFFTEWIVYCSQIICLFYFLIFFRFPEFFRIFPDFFPDFHQIFKFILFHRLLCSPSRTSSIYKGDSIFWPDINNRIPDIVCALERLVNKSLG